MNPQQLHANSGSHSHGFPFYDHRRGEDVSREHVLRESDLLNTIISFPSTSTQPFLLPRNSLQERIPSNFFIQNSNSSTVSFDVGTSRDESQQLMNSRDVCDSTMGSLGTDNKLRDKRPLSSIASRYNGENILSRFASDSPSLAAGGDQSRGDLWPYSDRNDIRGSVSATSDSSLQLPISNMRLGENLHNYHGAHNIISTMLQGNSDPGGGASYASGAHCRDGIWADDHGTELLLLPGISGVGSDNHHQNIPHAHTQAGRASVLVDNLKPLSEYLNMHSSDQIHEQNPPNFHGISTYATASRNSLRDLSLSLSAQENSQHVLYRSSGSLTGAGSMRSSAYLKEAQKVLSEVCRRAVTEGAAGSLIKSNSPYGSGGGSMCVVNAAVNSDLSFARAEEAPAYNVGSSEGSSLHALQQLRSSFDQAQVPAAMAQLQLHEHHHHLVSRLQNDHLQAAPFMDRTQLELKRRRLFIMLEELEKRFKRYEEQMQVMVIALETSGVGLMLEGAAPYKEVAKQAIQKRFAYLRDAILAGESFIMGGFSGDGGASSHPLPGAGECDQAGTAAATKFRLLDQQLRHQRALQQVGLFPQPPWRPQRGLPERSVSLLRAWLFDHFLHPYPKDTEKVLLARQTGLTRNQVSNWFINARVRLWKPMVEEMYQEEMKSSEIRRTAGQGNPKKSVPSLTHSSRNATGTSEFHADQSKKHAQSDFDNHVMAMQDLGSMSAMQGIETSRFIYKHNEIISHDGQQRPFPHHQDEQVSFTTSIEAPAGKAAMTTMLDAAQQCGTQTWPFIQHQNVSFDAQEQQHYCNSDISAALMRFGSSGGVTLTLGLQQHSSGGGGGSMNCAGPSPFERSPDDVNAAHRWCD